MKLLFILSYLIFFIGLLIFKKTNKKLNIIRYLVFQIMLIMVLNAIIMSILFVIGFGTAPMFVSSVLGVAGAVLIILSIKNKTFQKYEFKWIDLAAVIFIALVASVIGLKLFGTELHLAYNNVDPAAHFFMAQDNLMNGHHSGMFFYEVNNALIMNGLSIFTSAIATNYKLYLIIEIGMLALSGMMLYVLIAQFAKNKFRCGMCAVIAVLYMLGYSLNNMIFGFGYLGASVTLICFIMIICKALWDKKISLKIFTPLMAMSMLSISLCYMLFAPPIWIIVAMVIFGYCRKNKLKLKRTMLIELGVFIVPLILTIKFCYFDFFLGEKLDVTDQLARDGGAYVNYFSNFLVFAPAVIFAIYKNLKGKKSFVTTLFMLGWLAFVILALIAEKMGAMSPYYCLKTYYVLWLMTFVMFADGVMQFTEQYPKAAILGCAAVLGLTTTVDIYWYNLAWLRKHDIIGKETMDAYRFATDEIISKGEKITWGTDLSQYGRAFWFYSMQAVNMNKCKYCGAWNYENLDELKHDMSENKVDYIGIYKFDPASYKPYESLFEDKKIIFENNEVAIYK